jgi:hypothetical protein
MLCGGHPLQVHKRLDQVTCHDDDDAKQAALVHQMYEIIKVQH